MKTLYILLILSITAFAETRDSLYVEFSGDTVKIWNSTTLNCCSQFKFEAKVNEHHIQLIEIDTSKNLCHCLCDFNLCASLTGLAQGHYTVDVLRADINLDTSYVGTIQFDLTSINNRTEVQLSGYQSNCLTETQDETIIYSNSFESDQDTLDWQGYLEIRNEAAPGGDLRSAYISGGCLFPHAWYNLPPLEQDGYYILRCWGKNLEIGGLAGIMIDNYNEEVNISIIDKDWTYYESSRGLFCPSGKSITLFLGAGGIIPSSMLVDNIEIVKIRGSTIPTDVNDQWDKEIKEVQLFQNYPNPFNPVTKIKYAVPHIFNEYGPQRVQIKVYDLLGKLIEVLVDTYKYPGFYEVEFDGSRLPSAIYFYTLSAGGKIANRKMSLIK